MIRFSSWVLGSILLIAQTATAKESSKMAEAELISTSGEKVGTAFLTETSKGVQMKIEASNLPPGEHGVHFHEKGKCATPKFKSAGEHFNPAKKQHGLKNPDGSHAGDLPNLKVEADGTVNVEMTSSQVTLASGKNSLLKKGGTALVIHSKPDDQVTQPSGGSGDRIACGVIRLKSKASP